MVVLPESEALLGDAMDLRDHFPLEFGGVPRTKRAVLPDMLEAVKATAREEALDEAPAPEASEAPEEVGPPRPEGLAEGHREDDEPQDDSNPYMLPLSHELKLQGAHSRFCAACAVTLHGSPCCIHGA